MDGRKPCSLCVHPCRADIDRELATGVSVRVVAKKYNLARSSVGRHRVHLMHPEKRELRQVQAEIAIATPTKRDVRDRATLLAELDDFKVTLRGMLTAHSSNPAAVVAIIDRLHKVVATELDEATHAEEDVSHPEESAWRTSAFGVVAGWIDKERRAEAQAAFSKYCSMNIPMVSTTSLEDVPQDERRERLVAILRKCGSVVRPVVDTPEHRTTILSALGVTDPAADAALSACLAEMFKDRVVADDGIDRSGWWVPHHGPVPGSERSLPVGPSGLVPGSRAAAENATTAQGAAVEAIPGESGADTDSIDRVGESARTGPWRSSETAEEREARCEAMRKTAVLIARDFGPRKSE